MDDGFIARGAEEETVGQKKIVVYTRDWSSYCWRAKRLLKRKGYASR